MADMAGKHIIVIGSGIVGACIAWHLARAGAQVTVLEAYAAGGRATRDSWAWINASWGNPLPYFRLRQRSMREWQRVGLQLPDVGLVHCGGLIWDLPPEQLEAYAAEHSAWGYGLERVNAEQALRLEPGIKHAPAFALFVAEEGKVEPLAAALAFLHAAQRLGATVHAHTPVTALLRSHGRISGVRTEHQTFEADEVVVAAGTASANLLSGSGLNYPVDAPAGLLVHSKPTAPLLRMLLMAPGLHVRQTTEGRLVAGADYVGSIEGLDPQLLAQQLFSKVQAMVRGAENLEMDFYTLGHRPTPGDGFPMVGRPGNTDGLYMAVTHSGVTLAPALGLFVAEELVNGVRDSLLEGYEPDRLLR